MQKMNKRIIATIEARMTSTRLPGKVLLEAAGKSMLEHLVNRLRAVPSIHYIVLATTINKDDDILEKLANKMDIGCFRGSETDVLSRVIGAAELFDADIVVEITGDCPVIDPEIVEQTIRIFNANDVDYVSNAHVRSYPDGMDTQVFSVETLKLSASMTDEPLNREHVTLHIRNNPLIFSKINIVSPPSTHWPELGLTLDEKDDYILLKKIIEHFENNEKLFSCQDIINLLKVNQEWIKINQKVIRKGNN